MFIQYSKTELDENKCAKIVWDVKYNKAQFIKVRENHGLEKIFPTYDPLKHIIVECVNPLSYPTYDKTTDKIREMNRKELYKIGKEDLTEGEIFESDEFVMVAKPSDYHDWDYDTLEWKENIDRLISARSSELDAVKKTLMENGIMYQDQYWQKCRPHLDIPLMNSIMINFVMDPEFTYTWYFSNTPDGVEYSNSADFKLLTDTLKAFMKKVYDTESPMRVMFENPVTTFNELLNLNIKQTFEGVLSEYTLVNWEG